MTGYLFLSRQVIRKLQTHKTKLNEKLILHNDHGSGV